MPIVKLTLAYDGTRFHGWARQPGVRTVQGVVEEGLARLLGARPRLFVAGRTDRGVHAAGQVASFLAEPDVDLERVQRTLNGLLAPEVVVVAVRRAPPGFHARHSATEREYLYRIDTGPVPDPFTAPFVWHRPGILDRERMRRASRHLEGEHDFASFCRAPRPLTGGTTRHLRRLAVTSRGDRVEVRATANAFLHQMVRSLVGTLARVGEGKLDPDAMPAILGARSRAAAGQMAPPHGLTLVRVTYGRSPG